MDGRKIIDLEKNSRKREVCEHGEFGESGEKEKGGWNE